MLKKWLPIIYSLCLVASLPSLTWAQAEDAILEPTLDELIELERSPELRINWQANTNVRDLFRVSPARQVLRMNPGQTAQVEFNIFNLQGKTMRYLLSTEDFGADASDMKIKFYGTKDEGPYPARYWITPQVEEIILKHGERAYLSAKVEVPADAEPGDHLAALMIQDSNNEATPAGFNVTSRVATQFFITVNGEILEDATVNHLKARPFVNWSTPIDFELDVINNGTVHVAPEGKIKLSNLFGTQVGEVEVKDWILLRNSQANRIFTWQPTFALGRYTATANLVFSSTLGATEVTPVSSVFWIVPLVPVVTILLIILLIAFGLQYFFSQFELRRKSS